MSKKVFLQIKEFKELIVIVIFFLSMVSVMAVPFVDKRIDKRVAPIISALEFQNFLMMESMPDSIVEQAISKYTNSQKGIP